ncbi:hypothetical protein QBC44DRAFT_105009 [Cladorrhinum sp. PSN332]|nr:hypothetical protein QBC44DRAFT_105009 [Cladorrhinum sp. PSN332]
MAPITSATASRLARSFGPGNRDDQEGNSNPFQEKGGFFDDDHDDDKDGINIPPAVIVGIVVSIVVFFLLTTGFCVYKDRRRRRLAREKQVEIALKQSPSHPTVPSPVVIGGASNNISNMNNINNQDAPPPYEAAHIASRHPGAVHQWNRDSRGGMRGNMHAEDDITGATSTITDGIPPEGGKNAGLRIGS